VAAPAAALERLAKETDDDNLWRLVRQQFLFEPGLVYLNTGSIGGCPRIVLDSTLAFWRAIEANPVLHVFGGIGAQMQQVREKAARFLGADTEEMVLTRNTTEGMTLVATGLQLEAGDEVLTTTEEHPGGLLCWKYLEKEIGVVVRQIDLPAPPRDAGEILQRIEDAITPRTRVFSFSHVYYTTGLRLPIRQIADIAHRRDIFFAVDGAHPPGMLQVDLHALGCDSYASSSHKWMLAPKGSGLLYIRKEMQDRVRPAFLFSGRAPYTGATGTRNVPGILGHGVAMDFHNTIGRELVERRSLQLNRVLKERLQEIPGVRLLTSMNAELSSGAASIAIDGLEPAKVRATLRKDYQIEVKSWSAGGRSGLRISTHIYNSVEEIDRFVEALRRVIG
jgi:cysteine desulfurase/selenocysteine lyase